MAANASYTSQISHASVTGKCYGRAKIEHSCHLCRFNNFFSLALWLLQSHKGKDVSNNINCPSIAEHPIPLGIAYNGRVLVWNCL